MDMKGLQERRALKHIYLDVKRDKEGLIEEVYLYLKYLQETEKGIYEHKYEHILLPIKTNDLPVIKPGLMCINPMLGDFVLDAGFGDFVLDAGFGDCAFRTKDHTVRVLEEKSKEMTLDEIEKALGHKVKIVKEKGENK